MEEAGRPWVVGSGWDHLLSFLHCRVFLPALEKSDNGVDQIVECFLLYVSQHPVLHNLHPALGNLYLPLHNMHSIYVHTVKC